MNTQKMIERRNRLLGGAYRLFYDKPLHIVKGEGVWLTDAHGDQYLDCYNNVPHVGHCHPRVVDAICKQAATLNTHTRYLHETVLDYAEMLTARFPVGLEQAMFACSGTEANELALRIARAATNAQGMIVVEHAYHGNSWAIAQISDDSDSGNIRNDNVAVVPCPDTYRGKHRGRNAAKEYAAYITTAIETLAERGHKPCAFIVDTIFSSNGVPDVSPDYIKRAVDIVRDAGGVYVADEVQAGFGRTGTHFWGFEEYGVTPDIVTMGKPMGNGHPISAVVTSKGLIEKFQDTAHYFNTFGGNPVSCAAAKAVLEVIDEEALQVNALRMGSYIRGHLSAMAVRHEMIGDIRGEGLFTGVDLVTDGDSRAPASVYARLILNALRENGVLIGTTGAHDNVLKIRPPMTFSRENADFLLERLEKALKEVHE